MCIQFCLCGAVYVIYKSLAFVSSKCFLSVGADSINGGLCQNVLFIFGTHCRLLPIRLLIVWFSLNGRVLLCF